MKMTELKKDSTSFLLLQTLWLPSPGTIVSSLWAGAGFLISANLPTAPSTGFWPESRKALGIKG